MDVEGFAKRDDARDRKRRLGVDKRRQGVVFDAPQPAFAESDGLPKVLCDVGDSFLGDLLPDGISIPVEPFVRYGLKSVLNREQANNRSR